MHPNVESMSLTAISKESYVVKLIDKSANISSETQRKIKINSDIIKAVVSGDWLTGKSLYVNPIKFRSFAKHFYAMNELPNIDDPTHGMWRKVYIIEFPRIFFESEQDKYLTEKLSKEAPGIFNWALEGLDRLKKNNYIFTEVQSMEAIKKTCKIESNTVLEYADEMLKKSDNIDDKLKFKDVFEDYKEYCKLNGYIDHESKSSFRRMLQKSGFKIDNSTKDNNQVFIFNVKWSNDQDHVND